MRIIGEANNFLLRMHLAIPLALSNAYSTVHNNTLYYLHKKKKKIHDDRNKPTKAIEHEA
jgi:hypothetical protein